jgi:hypothetical protein
VQCALILPRTDPSDPNIGASQTFESVLLDAVNTAAKAGYPFFLSEYNAGLNSLDWCSAVFADS